MQRKLKHVAIANALLMMLFSGLPTAGAQVPAGAAPVTIKQVNTLSGQTTWTFSDPSGNVYYLTAPAFLVIDVPGSASDVRPMAAPGLWVVLGTPIPPTPTTSPDLTAIANNDGKSIIDATGGTWTVVNGQVELNSAPIGYSSGVVKLVTVKGVFWQQNSIGNWYYWNTTSKEWDGGPAPI